MMFRLLTRSFLESLSPDNETAIVEFGTEAQCLTKDVLDGLDEQEKLELIAAIVAFLKAKANISISNALDTLPLPTVMQALNSRMDTARKTLTQQARKKSVQQSYDLYLEMFSWAHPIVYEFTEEEHDRIQELINQLRDEIPKASLIDEGHKQRLLRKLEALQQELHKKVSDLDRFFGFVALAGIEAGKFGENIKPLTDRVRDLSEAVCNVIRAVENTPALPEAEKLVKLNAGNILE